MKIELELTDEEAMYLCSEMNSTLRQFGGLPYCGKQFTNETMVSAFQKVFMATGENKVHENIIKWGSTELLNNVN